MSESEHIAAPLPEESDAPDSVMDEETNLRPGFVEKVLDAVEAGDDETARKLVQPLHPADVADLIELARADEREGLVKALAGIISPDVLAEMNDYVREGLLDEMEPQQVADIAGQLETDDAVALIEDLDEDEQQAVLQRMEPDDRAAVEEALGYPEESAGRLMQRDLCAVHEHWKVGQVIDYLRSTEDLPTDFWEVFVVNPSHHPVGTCKLSTILRTPRGTLVSEIMGREQTLIPVDMDQEDVALRFQKYALVSAAVIDDEDRLVGMITVERTRDAAHGCHWVREVPDDESVFAPPPPSPPGSVFGRLFFGNTMKRKRHANARIRLCIHVSSHNEPRFKNERPREAHTSQEQFLKESRVVG